ncbi:hypothetical protein HRbin11_02339 [bacterium HR11]|nr:hypothetical protein HRbin11_02339 [bacterium HR11]
MFAAVAALAGLQVLTLGLILDLYAAAHKFTRLGVPTRWVLRPGMRKFMAGAGLALVGWGARLAASWAAAGFGPLCPVLRGHRARPQGPGRDRRALPSAGSGRAIGPGHT